MGKSRWEQYKEKNGVTPLDMLNPKTRKIDESFAEERLNICKSCPELISITHQCKKCGCFMDFKTKLEAAKCPLGKW
ncbi:hypothetical protein UFOVP225_27 [uncultured Caudovirales phage]|uniref:Uncharacterized protein n=1 Tax=uncultured Caudovirales phage TaxID=2100421 RepID=A0A6J7WQU3_9CAUD|nr:hypothetical protein UFOVP113_40 [uncultured Caudovirales phage]CAB5219125.1 hypothetical protein UFOVP225_27 [uncultured Caudovirales phage]